MRHPERIRRAVARILAGALLTGAVLAAHAQDTSAAPSLPPAPTPTSLYPGVGMSSSYTTSGGTALVAWQSLYLPIHGRLSAQVSIRNTDPGVVLEVASARHHDTNGKLIRDLLPAPLRIPPLGVHELALQRNDGGSVIIEWSAERPINPPLVEAVHGDGRTTTVVTTARPIQTR